MSYAKTIFFIPVWYDQFKLFVQALNNHTLWETTDPKKAWAGYLFRYASEINRNKDLFASYRLKDPTKLNVYIFQEEMAAEEMPHIDEV